MITKKICYLIQWERKKPPTDEDGRLICPECGEPAELILGVFGQPCYAHKILKEASNE